MRLPRSRHYATRRTKTVRRKKPGRSGRDDRNFCWCCFPSAYHWANLCRTSGAREEGLGVTKLLGEAATVSSSARRRCGRDSGRG
jgi:hypothetical protein